tara:strand:- start:1024 stop:1260 length:237 start_codon:yes stop_codon:yes gene_type:complete
MSSTQLQQRSQLEGQRAMHSNDISKKQVARIINISLSGVDRKRRDDDTFPRPYKIGGKLMFSEKEIRAWIESQKATRL